MSYEWLPIVDREGRLGRFASKGPETDSVRVVLESGERLTLPRTHVIYRGDGTYHPPRAFASLPELPRPNLIRPLLPAARSRGPLAFLPKPSVMNIHATQARATCTQAR